MGRHYAFFTDHFLSTLAMSWARTEPCKEFGTLGPQSHRSSAKKTTSWHCLIINRFMTCSHAMTRRRWLRRNHKKKATSRSVRKSANLLSEEGQEDRTKYKCIPQTGPDQRGQAPKRFFAGSMQNKDLLVFTCWGTVGVLAALRGIPPYFLPFLASILSIAPHASQEIRPVCRIVRILQFGPLQ